MNDYPSDIFKARNDTVSVSIATADGLCVASGTAWDSSKGYRQGTLDAPRQEFVVSMPYAISTQGSISVVLQA